MKYRPISHHYSAKINLFLFKNSIYNPHFSRLKAFFPVGSNKKTGAMTPVFLLLPVSL